MDEDIEVILVDVGNTQIKTAEVIRGEIGATRLWSSLDALEDNYPSRLPFVICSTRKFELEVFNDRMTKTLTHDIPLPIRLDYETPETLGTDRIAAAVGAMDLFPNENSLIIDLGTCMTIDFVDSKGVFRGGVISPGLKMRMKSMAHYTSNLPDVWKEWTGINSYIIGKSTKQCLINGSYWGMLHEINGIIRRFEKDFTTFKVILSGGDTIFFESNLKNHTFAGSKIVQTGLYRIWKYQ